MKITPTETPNTFKWELQDDLGNTVCQHSVPKNLHDAGYKTFLRKVAQIESIPATLSDREIFQLRKDCIDAEKLEDLDEIGEFLSDCVEEESQAVLEDIMKQFNRSSVDMIERIPQEMCGEHQFYSTMR
jgi:hypothetical protein